MSKFRAVYYNEMLKTMHKKSVWIIAIIMAVVIALMSLAIYASMTYTYFYEPYYDNYIESLEQDIEYYEMEIGDRTGADIDDTDEGKTLYSLLDDLEYVKAQLECYKMMQEIGITYSSYINYKVELFDDIQTNMYILNFYYNVIEKYDLYDFLYDIGYYYNYITTPEEAEELSIQNEKLIEIVTNNDFAAYIEMENAEIQADDSLDENQKKMYIELNNLRLAGNITGEYASHETVLNNLTLLSQYKMSLETGLDYASYDSTGSVLTPSQYEQYKQEAAIIEYKFESGYYNINEDSDIDTTFNNISYSEMVFSVCMVFMLILCIMLAGSSISTEIQNGSVKSLVVAPVKRWKIYAAKLLSVVTIGLAYWLICSVLNVMVAGCMFGFDSFLPYVYYAGNAVHSIAFIPYTMLYMLVVFVQVMFYASFAMMLSALTRNTAVSIAIPLGLYYMMASILSIVALFIDTRWTKYIPTESLSALTSSIFGSELPGDITEILTGSTYSINAWFAIVYVAVLIFAMLFTARDSFCRRDIK